MELVDLYPTLVGLARLPAPAHALEGTSFAPLLSDPERDWKSAAFSEFKREGYHGRTIRERRYRFTEWTPEKGTEGEILLELYNLESDPLEFNNLALDDANRAVVEDMSTRLKLGWQGALPEPLSK